MNAYEYKAVGHFRPNRSKYVLSKVGQLRPHLLERVRVKVFFREYPVSFGQFPVNAQRGIIVADSQFRAGAIVAVNFIDELSPL